MIRTSIWTGSILAMLLAVGCNTTRGDEARTPAANKPIAVRIGTFDSRGVALAYGRSARPDCMLAKVATIKREHDKAKETGNEDRMTALVANAAALQKQIHDQVFSGAPIDNVLTLIEADLARVAKDASLDLIVSGILHKSAGLQLVDITHELAASFRPDAKTQKLIRDIMTKPLVHGSHEH